MNTQTLKELIEINTFDEKSNNEMVDYLVKKFKPFSQEIIKLKNPDYDKYNLVIGLNTKLKNIDNAIILSGHIDTVIADEKAYQTNPYTITQIDNKIFGLGVIDMKCFFSTIIDNICLIKNLNYPHCYLYNL